MKTFWLITAGVCITAAAAFLLRDEYETAFVVATLGTIAWFLNYRCQITEMNRAADAEREEIIGAENLDDD